MIEHLEEYRAFYYTAKSGSLSRAAEELFVTQPAVTRSIKQLEGKLGCRLFFRSSRGVRLTPEGEALFPHIETAFHAIRGGERLLADMRELMAGELAIGAGDTLCKHYLLPRLTAFHAAYPAVKIRVTNRTTSETLSLLRAGKLDLGIVNLPVSAGDAVIRQTMEIEDCLVAGEPFWHLADKPLAWEELAGLPLILLEEGSATRAYWDRCAEQRGVAVKPEIELGSIDLLVDFARAGFGIACVVRNFVREELASGELREIRLAEPMPARGIGIATMSGMPLTSAADRFIREFGEAPAAGG